MSYRLLRIMSLGAACGIAACGVAAQTAPQDSSAQSIADAAKRAREQKKNAGPSSKVITDDDLDNKNVKPGAEGLTVPTPRLETEPPSPEAVAAAEAADKQADKSPADDPLTSTDDAKIARMKKALATAEDDVTLAQRELALAQDSFYANPDYQRDTAGQANLAELEQTINDRQDRVARLKAELAAAEEAASRKKGAAARAPAEPPGTTPQR
jgi:hypothetical protein